MRMSVSREGRTWFGIVLDATELKAAEADRARAAELVASEKHHRMVAQTVPMIIFTFNAQQQCTFVNQFFLGFAGVTLTECLGKGWLKCVHPEDIRSCDFAKNSYDAEGNEVSEFECRVRSKNGDYRWHKCNVTHVYNGGDVTVCIPIHSFIFLG